MIQTSSYGVVFSGGGALGAWEIGCYKAIFKYHNKPPLIVTGSSAGALNAAGIAFGLTAEDLEKLWTDLKSDDVYKTRKWEIIKKIILALPYFFNTKKFLSKALQKIDSIYDNSPLRNKLTNHIFKDLDVGLTKLNKSNLAISLSNISSENEVVKYKLINGKLDEGGLEDFQEFSDKIDFISSLVGSTAIPLIFPPENNLFDGGVLDNQPIGSAVKIAKFAKSFSNQISLFYVIIPSFIEKNKTKSLQDITISLMNTWVNGRYKTQSKLIAILKKIQGTTSANPVEVVTLRPNHSLTKKYKMGLLDFGKENISELINDGFLNATEAIKTLSTS